MANLASGDRHNPCPFPLLNVVPQPPPDYEPFNFPLAHTICLVTAYSESVEGLRTTLDSLATTDYPNSHKLILVIADGMLGLRPVAVFDGSTGRHNGSRPVRVDPSPSLTTGGYDPVDGAAVTAC
ncbi:chitin synthase-domain-containing protein [Mycena sp. CBHHK59/15]|nr:chitin synthase-domain-containing protein [Mycena sp. CBHHK59/15]